jgi:hypothetical protein
MPYRSFVAVLVSVAPLLSQNWDVPDNLPAAGSCNVIPFGSTVASSFYNIKFQTRVTAADLGGVANVITGLGFASCSTGRAHYDHIEIVLDHIPAAQPLSTTFANNLTPNAYAVLSATNYTWNLTANAWNEIGMQIPFVFNGVDDLVVQVTMVNGIAPAGFHRGSRQRIYWTAAAGSPPATGSTDSAASKVEVSMLMARVSSHGSGCAGSNGTPTLTTVGTGQPSTAIAFNLSNGLPGGIAMSIIGTTLFEPPIELSFLGMPTCYAYTDLAITNFMGLDGAGATSFAAVIPPTFFGFPVFSQYAVLDPAANAFGWTSSNYGRVYIGN